MIPSKHFIRFTVSYHSIKSIDILFFYQIEDIFNPFEDVSN